MGGFVFLRGCGEVELFHDHTEIFKNFSIVFDSLVRDCRYKKLRLGKAESLQNVRLVQKSEGNLLALLI